MDSSKPQTSAFSEGYAELAFEDIKVIAKKDENLPKGASFADVQCLNALKHLIEAYRKKIIDKKGDAINELRCIKTAWERGKDKERQNLNMAKYNHDLIVAVEGAMIRYKKERTLENADKLYDVLDGRFGCGNA